MMSRTNLPRNRAKNGVAGRATQFFGAIAPLGIIPPVSMIRFPDFSNDWLKFKHLFWAADGPEQGIFAAIPDLLGQPPGPAEAGRDPLADRLRQPLDGRVVEHQAHGRLGKLF